MGLIITEESHLDHGLGAAHLAFALRSLRTREQVPVFTTTLVLPAELPSVPCGLYGPIMGDAPVTEREVVWRPRGERAWSSRTCARPLRYVRELSVVGGMHGGAFVLFTAFGGPVAEREPASLPADADPLERARAEGFWSEHALVL